LEINHEDFVDSSIYVALCSENRSPNGMTTGISRLDWPLGGSRGHARRIAVSTTSVALFHPAVMALHSGEFITDEQSQQNT
jgi:hypothetical protein